MKQKISSKYILDNFLLNKWCIDKTSLEDKSEDDLIFYKHMIISDEKNAVYQIILSGNAEFNGIYKLCVIGEKFKAELQDDDITIKVKDNLDYYLFKGKDFEGFVADEYFHKSYGECVVKRQYKNEKCFKKALLETGLVTEKEYDLYTKPKKLFNIIPNNLYKMTIAI